VDVTSTVLDVTLCLLLVSAGAVTLATTTPNDASTGPSTAASERAQTLATTTATVEFEPAGATDRNPSRSRTRNGTVAALLADAAVRNLSVGGTPVSAGRGRFERAVGEATRATVGAVGVSVVARWQPFPGASITAVTAVGPSPPSDADVHAATVSVPSGLPSARRAAHRQADREGFAGVARVLGDRAVAGLYPTGVTAAALDPSPESDSPQVAVLRERYRRTAALADVRVATSARGIDVRRTNARLADAFATRFERELRREYETPEAAADAVEVGTVTVVVRTWSR
jgi:hypothetical protein